MAIREQLKRYNADEILFFLAVIFKPLYLLPSGSFQIGDFLFLSAVLVHFLASADRDLLFPIHREEQTLLIFVLGVTVINYIYWMILGNSDFIKNTIYYIFNYLIVIFAADILQTNRRDAFLKGLCSACKVVLLFQFFIYLTGLANLYGNERYMGTFNDPNQFAVYILFCILIMLDIYHEINLKVLLWLALGLFLIIPSGSTGSVLGVAVFLALYIMMLASNLSKQIRIAAVAVVLLFAVLFVILQITGGSASGSGVLNMMNSRLESKLKNATGISDMFNFLVNDRVWNRVFEQPKYLLYGAGEGAHSRFDLNLVAHEIHSSILGPPFYYGIGIAFFMFRWIYLKLRHIDTFQLCIYCAIITESLILVNYRQPLFWFLFVLAGRDRSDRLAIGAINEAGNIDSIAIQSVN